jgi:hypothetical protein
VRGDALPAVIDLGEVAVVGVAGEGDVVDRMVTAEAERAPVVELELLAGRAPPAVPVLVAAAASVPLVDGPPDRGRDVACRG